MPFLEVIMPNLKYRLDHVRGKVAARANSDSTRKLFGGNCFICQGVHFHGNLLKKSNLDTNYYANIQFLSYLEIVKVVQEKAKVFELCKCNAFEFFPSCFDIFVQPVYQSVKYALVFFGIDERVSEQNSSKV